MRGLRPGNAIRASGVTLVPRKSYAQDHHARRQLDGPAEIHRHGLARIPWPPGHRGSRPRLHAGNTEEPASRSRRFGRRSRRHSSHAHSPRPRRSQRRAGAGKSPARGLRPQTRRAAHDRPFKTPGERRAALAGQSAPTLRRRRARGCGEPPHPRRWRDASVRLAQNRGGVHAGHASHHVSYFEDAEGVAFVGDTTGIRIEGHSFVMPATPPPDIDLKIWDGSFAAILDRKPKRLFLTHFGFSENPAAHIAQFRERLHHWMEITESILQSAPSDEAAMASFITKARAEISEHLPPEDVEQYAATAGLNLSFLGLARHARKRAQAAS